MDIKFWLLIPQEDSSLRCKSNLLVDSRHSFRRTVAKCPRDSRED